MQPVMPHPLSHLPVQRDYLSAEELADISATYAQVRANPACFDTPELMQGFPPDPEQIVNWGNWMTPPFNRWAYPNIERIRPMVPVRRGKLPPSTLPVKADAQNINTIRFDSVCGEEVSVAEHLAASRCDSFIVLQRGEVLLESYFNGQQPEDRHIMFSVTKSLIGVIAEQVIAEGKMKEDTLAGDIIPELAGSAYADATVREVMDMAVGISYTEKYDDPDSESSIFGYACGFLPAPEQYRHLASLYDFLPTLKKRGEHGGLFHYVTATTEVLAWLVERSTNISCAEHLGKVFAELGCEQDGLFTADPKGRNVTGAGSAWTLRDLARFAQLLLNKGKLDGKQLLADGVVDAIAQGADPAIYAANTDFSAWLPDFSYRSQWYVLNKDTQAMMACGICGQYIYIDFPSQVVIVRQASLPEATPALDFDTPNMFRQIVATLNK
ncbi:serine hydrolase domain-containing protein [Thalassolituus sp. UBA6592]|uniref:serine hydrolase domain-containing protein n=2 Tax=unclassified Thalassolituus TaxID=2624967 RepID=UPI0025DB3035|nr:serine hydrolase [Thalassolituus sp. UBA6592]